MAASLRGSGRIFNELGNQTIGSNEVLLEKLKKRTSSRAQTARTMRCLTEALEDRRLMTVALPASVLPAAISSVHTFITPISTSDTTGTPSYSSPSVAVDPLDEPWIVGSLRHESGVFFPELLLPAS